MNTDKLQERSRSVALKTLAAVEAVERRIASGESGAAIRHAAQQLRGSVDALLELGDPSHKREALIDDETRSLTARLDARVRAIEERLGAEPKH